MKVTQYFVGFGPRLWSIKRGETEYGVRAIPAGGFVKIPGMTNLEDVDPEDEPRAYRNRPFPDRLLVAVAGSVMHFIMAFLLLLGAYALVGTPNNSQVQIEGFTHVAGVANPAQAAGMRPGDILKSVNGKSINGSLSVLTAALNKATQSNADQSVTVVVDRHGKAKQLTVTPVNSRKHHEDGKHATGVIGVDITNPLVTENPVRAVGSSVVEVGQITGESVMGIVHLFAPHQVVSRFDTATSAKAASQADANGTRAQSIVGIVNTGDQAAQAGIGTLLQFLAIISIFLGVLNMFPLLPLDGGHVVIAIYERIRTRRGRPMYHADVAKMMPFTYVLLAFLAVLVVTALVADLAHPAANPFG
jgi:RIP metalloprotease RseP